MKGQALLFIALLAAVLSTAAAARRLTVIEHLYYDASQTPTTEPGHTLPTLDTDGSALVPVMAKAKCKGKSCPELHGEQVTIRSSAWASVNGVRAFVEETSGWLLFWRDDAMSVPVVPSTDDLDAINSGQRGYLRDGKAGSVFTAGD